MHTSGSQEPMLPRGVKMAHGKGAKPKAEPICTSIEIKPAENGYTVTHNYRGDPNGDPNTWLEPKTYAFSTADEALDHVDGAVRELEGPGARYEAEEAEEAGEPA